MAQPTYPFDPTGVAASNLIQNEDHTVQVASGTNLSFIIPRAAPFFRTGVQLVRVNGTVETPLVENVDYVFAMRYQEATIQTSLPIYGGIAFLNRAFSGTVRLKQYQTLGGEWVLDDYTAVEQLTNALYAVRTVYWDQLVEYPNAFPPYNHDHTMDDATGFAALITELESLRTTIASSPSSAALAALALHQSAPSAHTKAQVGLPLVDNFATATPTQTAAGVATNLFVTPAGVAQALAGFTSGATGNRNITLGGDVTGTETVTLENATTWGTLNATIADAYKGIDTRAYPTGAARGPDPNVTTMPVFFTNHQNSPAGASGTLADNLTRTQFFIINLMLKTATSDTNAYARAQIAIEQQTQAADNVQRVFVRYREFASPYNWTAWKLISSQDNWTTYGKAYGNSTTNANPDNIIDPVSKIQIITPLNGLPVGTYIMSQYLDTSYGVAPGASNSRVQVAQRIDNYAKACIFMRYGDGTIFGRWINVGGAAVMLNTNTINSLFEEGDYDQDDSGGIDLTTVGYPVDLPGRLTVIRLGSGDQTQAVTNGVKQRFQAFGTLAEYIRQYGVSSWGSWIQTRNSDGSVPASAMTSVPAILGGGGPQTQAAVQSALGLGNLATYTIIMSPTEPVSPPAQCLWVVPVA